MFTACGKASMIQMLGTYLRIFLWQAWAAEQPDIDFCMFTPFNNFYVMLTFLKKKKKCWIFLFPMLINDMFTSAPSPKSNNYRINVFFNSPQYQKQRCATCKSKQGDISRDYKANEKRLEIAELGSFSTIWPYFPCPRNSCKHGHFHLKN